MTPAGPSKSKTQTKTTSAAKKGSKSKTVPRSPKAAGRPAARKTVSVDRPAVPKRRGRPPKALKQAQPLDVSAVTSAEAAPPRRRGRPPKEVHVSSYEGLQNDVRRMETPAIEVWANQYSDREYTVDLTFPEFTCVCPKTGLPDFAVIRIRYIPRKWCLELKSVKLYMISYRQVGIFHEHLVNRILDDLVKACQPRWMEVEAVMNPRGGITTRVSVTYPLRRGRGRKPTQPFV